MTYFFLPTTVMDYVSQTTVYCG